MGCFMQNLEDLLKQIEGCEIEYKLSKSKLSKDLWETYSAFANTNGGYIILGMKQVGQKFEIDGVENAEKQIDDLYNTVASQQKVSINLLDNNSVKICTYEGKDLIVIKIRALPMNRKPLYLNGNMKNVYIRKNSGDYLATEEELRRFIRNADDHLDGELLDEYTIEDLDTESILKLKNVMDARKPSEGYLEMTNSEFLKKMGIFKIDRSDDRKLKMTIAGLLFLGTEEAIQSKLPHFHLDYLDKRDENVRWLDRVCSNDLNYTNLNLFKFYDIVKDKIFATVNEPFALDENAVRKSTAELKEILREALVNMLVHADYFDSETSIRTEVHKVYYTFHNPGEMKISLEQFFLGNQSVPRNSTLFNYFKLMGASEKEGGGGSEIYNVTKRYNFRLPEINTTSKDTFLKIWIAYPKDSYPEYEEITRNILLYIFEHSMVGINELKEVFNITDYRARKSVDKLLKDKHITRIGNGKSTQYIKCMTTLETIAAVDSIRSKLLQ